jgi:hypothetical protein
MNAESKDTGREPLRAVSGEPAFFGRLAASEDYPHVPARCTHCGGADLLTEPELDEEKEPTGLILVLCGSCGRQIGELAPSTPVVTDSGAEPQA